MYICITYSLEMIRIRMHSTDGGYSCMNLKIKISGRDWRNVKRAEIRTQRRIYEKKVEVLVIGA